MPLTDERSLADGPDERFHRAFILTAGALLVVGLWLRPLVSSLWIDEAGTWWVINGNAGQVVQRAEAVQGQSPFYYVLVWAWTHVFGTSEAALRLPSLLFSLVTLGLVYLVARRLVSREVASISVVTYAAWHQVVFEATDARPYAFSTMMIVAAAWMLIAWLDSGGIWRGACFVTLATLVPYAHPISALALIPLFIYAIARVRGGSSALRPSSLVTATVVVGLLAVPVFYQVITLAGRHEEWNIPASLSLGVVLTMLVPTAFVATALIVAMLLGLKRVRLGGEPFPPDTRLLLVTWFLLPSCLLFVLTLFSPVQLLGTRYYLMVAPAGAIIAATLLRAMEPANVRRVIVLILVVLSVIDLTAIDKGGDIRGALAVARSRADERSVTFLTVGFRESDQRDWYADPAKESLLVAPASYYPVPGRVLALPIDISVGSIGWARARVEAASAASDRVIVVSRPGSPYELWFNEVLRDLGYSSQVAGTAEGLVVTEYSRTSS